MAEKSEESPSFDDAAATATHSASATVSEGGTARKKRQKKPPSPRIDSMKGVSGSVNGE